MDQLSPTTWLIVSITLGGVGAILIVQAGLQARLLRSRIARGLGTAVFDPVTGMFSAAAAWQCIRAEGNRAARLERPLDVWIGTAPTSDELDIAGKQLAFDLPGSVTAVRIGRRQLCIFSCADFDAPQSTGTDLAWANRSIPAGGDTAEHALEFVSEVLDRG